MRTLNASKYAPSCSSLRIRCGQFGRCVARFSRLKATKYRRTGSGAALSATSRRQRTTLSSEILQHLLTDRLRPRSASPNERPPLIKNGTQAKLSPPVQTPAESDPLDGTQRLRHRAGRCVGPAPDSVGRDQKRRGVGPECVPDGGEVRLLVGVAVRIS